MKGKATIRAGASLTSIMIAGAAVAQTPPLTQQPDAPASTAPGANPASNQAPAPVAAQASGLQEIVVTAQKREQAINSVPLSITAASGEKLANLGISSTQDLGKVVPGFSFTESAFATPVYTLRGIGFYDTSLGAKPTVSVYLDQVPLPFSILTEGATLDLERVEVLKGPQGTLFGSNATGGAINYIAAKPTSTPKAGFDTSINNFGGVEAGGFISGPISDTLTARVAVHTDQFGAWQKSYTRDDKLGDKNFTTGRLLVDFKPTAVRFELNLNGYVDKSDGQAAQLIGVVPLGNPARLGPIATYPDAPHNDRDADWTPGQDPKRNNWFYQGSLRGDADLASNLTLTSITAYSRYHHDTDIDPDGLALKDYFYDTHGRISSFSQELRLTGKVGDNLTYIVGGNYERDRVYQRDDSGPYTDATSAYQLVDAGLTATPFFRYSQFSDQKFNSKAAFGNVDYDLGDKFTLHGGVRYTDTKINYSGCTADVDGGLAGGIQNLLNSIRGGVGLAPITVPQGSCVTINAATLSTGAVTNKLDQHNVSWRGGLDYKPRHGLLFYLSASKGFKSGSFPILSASDVHQLAPVTQESVIAYEAGFKASLGPKIQLNGAAFYYDYNDKQLKGRVVATPNIFGPLEALVNVPKSSVTGGELQLDVAPVRGLALSLAGTYVDSKIKGNFTNYDSFGDVVNFKGSAFPYTPKFTGVFDAQYDWSMSEKVSPFIGGNVSHNSKTKAVLGDGETPSAALNAQGGLDIKAYTLVDLRAGLNLDGKKYRVGLFVRNLFNEYYWTNATRITDTVVRFTGLPRTFGASFSARF